MDLPQQFESLQPFEGCARMPVGPLVGFIAERVHAESVAIQVGKVHGVNGVGGGI
jgi:hypothetical protein